MESYHIISYLYCNLSTCLQYTICNFFRCPQNQNPFSFSSSPAFLALDSWPRKGWNPINGITNLQMIHMIFKLNRRYSQMIFLGCIQISKWNHFISYHIYTVISVPVYSTQYATFFDAPRIKTRSPSRHHQLSWLWTPPGQRRAEAR